MAGLTRQQRAERAQQPISQDQQGLVATIDAYAFSGYNTEELVAHPVPEGYVPPLYPYRWNIPVADNRYWPIEATAPTVDEARSIVLAFEHLSFNELERHFIQTTAPMIAEPGQFVTLSHADALADNERLNAQHAEIEAAQDTLRDAGIDPANPMDWVQEYIDAANTHLQVTMERAADERMHIGVALTSAIEALRSVGLNTGCLLPETQPETIDGAGLTILVDDGNAEQVRRLLPRATFIDRPADAELTDAERRGLKPILVWAGTRLKQVASLAEQKDLDAAIKKVKALTGVA